MYERYIKRFFDILISGCALIAASPLLLIIALAVRLENHSSPIFVQKRYGRNRKLIRIYKFKSMRDDAPHDMPTDRLENAEQYITKTGLIIRRTSLDELPQLWNIFKGEMSLVGPRPALWNQYYLMDLREKSGAARLRPGLTGLAQINGRDMLNDDQKAAYDAEYARTISFKTDLACFLRTFAKVLDQDDIRHE